MLSDVILFTFKVLCKIMNVDFDPWPWLRMLRTCYRRDIQWHKATGGNNIKCYAVSKVTLRLISNQDDEDNVDWCEDVWLSGEIIFLLNLLLFQEILISWWQSRLLQFFSRESRVQCIGLVICIILYVFERLLSIWGELMVPLNALL